MKPQKLLCYHSNWRRFSDKSDRSDRIGKHPRGCHSASPESRLEEPKTRGKGGAVYPSTLVVALG